VGEFDERAEASQVAVSIEGIVADLAQGVLEVLDPGAQFQREPDFVCSGCGAKWRLDWDKYPWERDDHEHKCDCGMVLGRDNCSGTPRLPKLPN
jgi:hypothetical protein